MLEGFQPLDLSFLNSGSATSTPRNRVGLSQGAMEILGRSKWNETPLEDLYKSGVAKKPIPHNQSTWSRIVDILSMPAYAVANAADNAIAGHQSSSDDSVLSDIGQVIGGLGSGAFEGVKAGLRGGFAFDEYATNPKDKILFGEPMVRWDLGMSAEDAQKPENREKVRAMLQEMGKDENFLTSASGLAQQIPIVGGWTSLADETKGQESFDDEAIDQYFKDKRLQGLAVSAVADPLNLIGVGAKAPRVAAEIPQILGKEPDFTKAGQSLDALNTGAVGSSPIQLPKLGVSGSFKVALPGDVQNAIVSGDDLIRPPSWFNFPKSPAEVNLPTTTPKIPTEVAPELNEYDEILDAILVQGTSRPDIPKNLERVSRGEGKLGQVLQPPVPKDQLKLASSLLGRADFHRGNIAKALVNNQPNVALRHFANQDVPIITAFMDRMSKIKDLSKRMGVPAERAKIHAAIDRVVQAQGEALQVGQKVKSANSIVNEATEIGTLPVGVPQGPGISGHVSKNPVRDAEHAQAVFDKFSPQIIGDALPSGIKNAAQYRKAVSNNITARYSGEQQVQMWNHLTSVILKNVKTPNRFALTNNILRQVEDMFIAQGKIPMSQARVRDATPLRLSQVLEAIGPAAAAMTNSLLTKILRGDPQALATLSREQIQALEALKANEAIVDAAPTVTAINAVKDLNDLTPKGPLSAGRLAEADTISGRVAADIAANAGASARGQMVARQTFTNKSNVDLAVDSSKLNTTALISHPDVSSKLLAKYSNAPAIARAIAQEIGSPVPSVLGRLVGQKALVPEWLGARFNAAYKNPDMRVHYLRNVASAKTTVAMRATYLNDLARKFGHDPDMWNDAVNAAQGKIPTVAGTPADELGQEFLKVMENIFGSSGLKAGVALENSVAGRSQLFMKELNNNLKRFGLGQFQFVKDGDYADGVKWLNSWESWDIKKPLEFLFKIQNVVEHTTREKLMFDDIVARFGVPKSNVPKGGRGEFRHTVNHPRLSGYYFGPEAASQLNQFVKNLKEISKPTSSKLMQQFDHVLSKWKAGVTIYVPSHHIRNVIGDTYLNWLAGVDNVTDYSVAMKAMKSQPGRYPTLELGKSPAVGLDRIEDLTNPNALSQVLKTGAIGKAPTAAGRNIAFTMSNGQKVTNDMFYVAAFQEGILPATRVLEDIPDDVAVGIEKIRPLGGKGQRAAHNLSEARDHWARLAQFSHELKNSRKPFEAAVKDAAYQVRKWHPDGMDLTAFEKNVMRRVFPFYSWTRKAIPLVVESILATPGKVMVYPKVQYGIQQMMGIESPSISDPFPTDQLFPDWIREKGIGPVFGGQGDYSILNPSNPTLDIMSQFGGKPVESSMNMLNPAIKIPGEIGFGHKPGGAPADASDPDYWLSQIPGISHAGRATGQWGTSDTVKEQGTPNWTNIINMLTAGGLTNTGQYQKSGQFDLRDFLKSQR